uniref:Uncharacterized protein TCIL3000_4_2140 n=1 Tax=Trypanosoma congolense (strain IL3000) TaxID=1068625 RepID=G0UL69_TRYCI|nr:unnamed protein product [Trypanosoma congolense IL3000]
MTNTSAISLDPLGSIIYPINLSLSFPITVTFTKCFASCVTCLSILGGQWQRERKPSGGALTEVCKGEINGSINVRKNWWLQEQVGIWKAKEKHHRNSNNCKPSECVGCCDEVHSRKYTGVTVIFVCLICCSLLFSVLVYRLGINAVLMLL